MSLTYYCIFFVSFTKLHFFYANFLKKHTFFKVHTFFGTRIFTKYIDIRMKTLCGWAPMTSLSVMVSGNNASSSSVLAYFFQGSMFSCIRV